MKFLSDDEIKKRLNKALYRLYVQDFELLENVAHERSITHKLGEYLQKLFPGYDVDCEYNLDINNYQNRKRWVSGEAREKLKKQLQKIQNELKLDANDLNEEINKISSIFYPDIIVHKRRTNKHNLLIIEAKKSNITDKSFDEEKLQAFTRSVDRYDRYEYQLGALVTLDVGNNFRGNEFTEPEYYVSGQKEKL